MKEKWFVSYYGKQELGSCTLRGSFPGEVKGGQADTYNHSHELDEAGPDYKISLRDFRRR